MIEPVVLADAATIRARLSEVVERIDAAGDAKEVTIVAVTKAFDAELVTSAVEAGLEDLGENYAQELRAKCQHLGWEEGRPATAPRFHFIGGLQRNKIKQLGQLVHLWQTIDRAALVDELAKRCPGASMLVQVNTTGEDQKAGCDPAAAPGLVERAMTAGLEVRGLMTVGPTDPGTDPRPAFAALRRLADDHGLGVVSMGMSGDFELAVAEGATMVRLGSVLFGPRPGQSARHSG